jgi:NAD(P)-dependent dehydrogenase (short-subunit alcohol dehydrogenase family)
MAPFTDSGPKEQWMTRNGRALACTTHALPSPAQVAAHALAAILGMLLLAGSGSGLRAQAVADDPARRGGDERVILITGSTDGLGREVARRLARDGAHIIVHGRNRERGTALVAEIERAGRGSAAFYAADLASLDEVRGLAAAITRDYDRVDVLVNNAGIWLRGNEARQLNAAGHELHFAVNYLSGVLLTRLLLPLIERSGSGRIVNVASGAQAPIDFDDVMLADSYTPSRAYAQSKLAQVMFTFDLAAELGDAGVMVVALHPASLMDTPMVREAGVRPRTTVAEGAEAVVNLISSPGIETGAYFDGLHPATAHAQAYDADARARLRALSHALAGLSDA